MERPAVQLSPRTWDVMSLAVKYAQEIPACSHTWGVLTGELDDAFGLWFRDLGTDWEWPSTPAEEASVISILKAVVARDSGGAVCAEGLVAVAAWDLSEGHLPTATDLYRHALEEYEALRPHVSVPLDFTNRLLEMSAEHDKSSRTYEKTTGRAAVWHDSTAFLSMKEMVHLL